ncbi:neurogenic locus notch homolog protein 2-like [Lytechinus variegatus]|uniref:neurogenic locus notch homolog protein 2-like n=1 Tax=Lytechinus variegatus TaxID=7654 RepID=UPI001BB236C2|nr:neurogenic locus notch homolog protein 2-like [Lytechinus variegatus]
MPGVIGLFVLILGSPLLFSTIDSVLLGATGCGSIICPVVFDEATNANVQLVPKIVPTSPTVPPALMRLSGVANEGNTWTCVYPDIDECASSPCGDRKQCIDGEGSYRCECTPGYAGPDCEIDINECASNPCQNGGSCTDNLNHYTCSCQVGFKGKNCDTMRLYPMTTCEHEQMQLDCGPDHRIHIKSANFGRKSGAHVCSLNRTLDEDCSSDSASIVMTSCEGASNCTLPVNTSTFGDPCPDVEKYLSTNHRCLCSFHTEDSGSNHNYHWLFPVSRIKNGLFKFLVRAAHDVHVALADRSSLYGKYVEIVLCGWSNSAVGIRRDCTACTPVVSTSATLCQNNAFTEFQISFADGYYQVMLLGQTETLLLQWQDPNPFDVTRVGVFSGYGSDADWMFYSNFIP